MVEISGDGFTPAQDVAKGDEQRGFVDGTRERTDGGGWMESGEGEAWFVGVFVVGQDVDEAADKGCDGGVRGELGGDGLFVGVVEAVHEQPEGVDGVFALLPVALGDVGEEVVAVGEIFHEACGDDFDRGVAEFEAVALGEYS